MSAVLKGAQRPAVIQTEGKELRDAYNLYLEKRLEASKKRRHTIKTVYTRLLVSGMVRRANIVFIAEGVDIKPVLLLRAGRLYILASLRKNEVGSPRRPSRSTTASFSIGVTK